MYPPPKDKHTFDLYMDKQYSLRGSGIIFSPNTNELVKMVGTKDRGVPSEVVKVVHDDCHKEVKHKETEVTQKRL